MAALWGWSFFLRESPRTNPLEGTSLHRRNMCGETLGDLEPVYDLFPITGKFALPEAVILACTRHLCEAGRFSYGESSRTLHI